jgi:tRNA 2-thiouridine synthesizing protein B
MKSILILLSSGPTSRNALRALHLAHLLRGQGHRVSVYLLQDGVLCALTGPGFAVQGMVEEAKGNGVGFYVLDEDLALRGFQEKQLIPEVRVSDYSALVDLMMERSDSVLGVF